HVKYFINKYCLEIKTSLKTISKEALDMLMSYHWKGNVRELENTIERAIILCDGEMITQEHIILSQRATPMEGTLGDTAKEALRIAETQRIVNALRDTKGNKSRAAEVLHVSYKTLLTKIKEYGIEA
ncbi:MAG: AAA family ATPase, partial [Nitrospirota bacterium]|nr:AAA family ATPase [Nitrospirota bacterium]